MFRNLVFVCCLSGIVGSNNAQQIEQTNFEKGLGGGRAGVPSFELAAYSFAGLLPNETELTVEFMFANDALQFVKSKDGQFRAGFQAGLTLLKSDSSKAVKKTWSGLTIAENFDQTNDPTLKNRTGVTVVVAPGTYTFKAEIIDHETRHAGIAEGKLTARAFSEHGLQVSDLRIKASDDDQGVKRLLLEIYNVPSGDSVQVKITGDSEKNEFEEMTWRIPSEGDRIPLKLNLTDYDNSLLSLNVTVSAMDTFIVISSKPRLSENEISIENIDMLVEQLIYIAQKKEIKVMMSAQSEEKVRLFQEFWQKWDPSPGTPGNEWMQEYYRRIDYANEHFSNSRDGWQTDMGQVYIKLGPPDMIADDVNYQRYVDPLDLARPTQVWQYTSLDRNAIFVNKSGEYRLANFVEMSVLLNRGVRF